MKVAHLQTHLPSSGNPVYYLHKAFIKRGIESLMLSRSSERNNEENIYTLKFSAGIIAHIYFKIVSKFLKVNPKYGIFSYNYFGYNLSNLKILKDVDCIYLHWINHSFLSLRNIKQLAKLNKPIIFFTHDMWTVTGGCHHSFDCDKYKSHCGSCQMLFSQKEKDFSWHGFNNKMKLFQKYNNLFFVSPSRWLYNCAKESQLTINKPVFHIPNLVDTNIFKPSDKKNAKHYFNIDPDNIVISFGAVSVNSPYKGWSYIKEALKILSKNIQKEKVTVLVFGGGLDVNEQKEIPFNINYLGSVKDDYVMPLIYNASDVFIAPSLAEAFGLVILESICCGTPVVAFEVGGIPDIIKHKYNGYIAKYKDSKDLAAGIKFCIEEIIMGEMLPEFNENVIMEKHLKMLNEIK